MDSTAAEQAHSKPSDTAGGRLCSGVPTTNRYGAGNSGGGAARGIRLSSVGTGSAAEARPSVDDAAALAPLARDGVDSVDGMNGAGSAAALAPHARDGVDGMDGLQGVDGRGMDGVDGRSMDGVDGRGPPPHTADRHAETGVDRHAEASVDRLVEAGVDRHAEAARFKYVRWVQKQRKFRSDVMPRRHDDNVDLAWVGTYPNGQVKSLYGGCFATAAEAARVSDK